MAAFRDGKRHTFTTHEGDYTAWPASRQGIFAPVPPLACSL